MTIFALNVKFEFNFKICKDMKTIMAQFVSNTEVILTDTCLNISKSFDRFIPFQEETDFIEWISYNLTDKFSDFIVHFCHVDFDKDNNIKGFKGSFEVPEYICIKECNT